MKGFIAICLVASLSLLSYSTFWSHHSGFPESPDRSIVNLNHIATELIHEETNVSHVLFGIGGSAKTWSKRRHYSELWWKNGITRGFVWLDEKPAANVTWPDMSPPYKVLLLGTLHSTGLILAVILADTYSFSCLPVQLQTRLHIG
ncbi:hypothetical protein RHMOL_Rhmol05G0272700 [Rhododendron molle]|uniref:Uncharacterized protein n=1 Tax=Rhododendron molle TaxID=49168 RepID=A0ACC0NTH5_RHOML|nr:hypothetical protein RHMOL_Rhmol05G0272700 [Rhododendron molle]